MGAMKAMKTMKAGSKAMTKGAMIKAIATEHDLKTKECSVVLESLAAIATKDGVRMMFGVEQKVKAKPARTVVKAFPAAALKAQIYLDECIETVFGVFRRFDGRGNPTERA